MRRILLAVLLSVFLANAASAACTSPPGNEGQMIYTTTYHSMEFCNGSQWVNMTGGNNIYSPGGSTNPTFTASNGYFVLSAGSYTGNLGGLSGADAKCLSELTSNNWNGKSAAQGFGLLNATHVHAFLCDTGTCNSPTASKSYYFATAGDTSAGGSYFTADSGGRFGNGTGGNIYNPDGIQWSALSTFNVVASIWTNEGINTSSTSNTPNYNTANGSCNGWAEGTGGSNAGLYGNTGAADNTRWNQNYTGCGAAKRIACFVNP